MFTALARQFNIIKALTIHDLQGQMKTYNYGFVWMLLDPLIYIFIFRMARKAMGGSAAPGGMTPFMFFILGMFPLYLYMAGLKAGMSVGQRSNLLLFPRVTPVDLAFADGLSQLTIYITIFILAVPAVAAYENVFMPQNLIPVIFALLISWVIGLGMGLALSGALRVFPPLKMFISYTTFGLRMASGMFFCITEIPQAYWPYLTWNPLLHAAEMSRDGWFESYTSPIASPTFMSACALGLLLFGLLVERLMRRVPFAS